MGLGRVGERKGLVDLRLDAAGFDQRPDLLAQAARNGSLELAVARTRRGAGDRQAPAHHRVDIELGARAAQIGDEDEPAFFRDALQLAWHVVAADHVEDHVDAFAAGDVTDFGGPVLRLVVERALGAELYAGGDFFIAAGRGENAVAG